MPLPLCKFCSAEGAAKLLAKNSIFITSPLDLNDPFEMRPAWTDEHELDQYEGRQIRNDLTKEMQVVVPVEGGFTSAGSLPELGTDPPIPVADQLGSDYYNEIVFDHIHRRFRVLSLVLPVLDLSRKFTISRPEDTLMWSHYGDQFQGVCLILDAEKFNNGLKPGGFNVAYKPLRKSLPPSLYNPWKTLLREQASMQRTLDNHYIDILTSKSPLWRYEGEVRMIYEKSALNPREDFSEVTFPCPRCTEKGIPIEQCKMPLFRDVVKLPPEAILGLIFGADCPSNYVSELLPALAEERYRHIKLYWSSLHSNEYAIHYCETDASGIENHQRAHTDRIARAKRHTFHGIRGYGCGTVRVPEGN